MDSTWKPVKGYIRYHIKPNDKDTYYFDPYDPSELEQVMTTQQKMINYQQHKNIYIYHILFVIDDFADDTIFTRKLLLLHQLYIHGRHYIINTITSTQVFTQISPIVRKNMTLLFFHRLRHDNDLESIVEQLMAILIKHIATNIS